LVTKGTQRGSKENSKGTGGGKNGGGRGGLQKRGGKGGCIKGLEKAWNTVTESDWFGTNEGWSHRDS